MGLIYICLSDCNTHNPTKQSFSVSEQAVGKDTIEDLKAPEEILRGLGATYSKASADWGPHVEVDTSGSGPLVTGNLCNLPWQSFLEVDFARAQSCFMTI